jgi:hypothetical protein
MAQKSGYGAVQPNAVLRGGALDGEQRHIDSRATVGIEVGPDRVIYRPTAELDSEYPALAVWAYDHAETEAG